MQRTALVASVSFLVVAAAICAERASAGPSAATPLRMDPEARYLVAGDTRKFSVKYVAQVKDVPAGAKKLRVWIPVPQDTPLQTITGLSFEGAKPSFANEPRFGDRIAYFEVDNPSAQVACTMTFTCARREVKTDLAKLAEDGKEADAAPAAFLADDKFTTVDESVKKTAAEITAGKTTTLAKARAIYDYVLSKMTYDKTAPGWGNGDTKRAFEVCKGNCTDFHAMFISLARASGIPAGFEIGLYLPYERHKKDEALGGYHCWAWFRMPGRTWVPVDISEASKNKDRAEYFFGAYTSNRVTLSVGRDIVLEPKQDGAPLNYFLKPYAEADGKPVATDKTWSFEDLD